MAQSAASPPAAGCVRSPATHVKSLSVTRSEHHTRSGAVFRGTRRQKSSFGFRTSHQIWSRECSNQLLQTRAVAVFSWRDMCAKIISTSSGVDTTCSILRGTWHLGSVQKIDSRAFGYGKNNGGRGEGHLRTRRAGDQLRSTGCDPVTLRAFALIMCRGRPPSLPFASS